MELLRFDAGLGEIDFGQIANPEALLVGFYQPVQGFARELLLLYD